MLISQMAKDGKINIVIGKGLSISGHAEVFEPVLNLLHRGHQGPSWLSFSPRQQRVYINKFAIARPFKKRGSAGSRAWICSDQMPWALVATSHQRRCLEASARNNR